MGALPPTCREPRGRRGRHPDDLRPDVRAILPTIRVPTLVVSRRDNPLFPADAGRAVAELIPGAVFVEVPGADYGPAIGDVDPVIDEVEAF